jgi:hypothetical protein
MPAPLFRWRYLPLLCLCLAFLGCLSLTVDLGPRPADPDGVVTQTGCVSLRPGETRDVYYAAPFHSIPQFSMSSGWFTDSRDISLMDQHPDHFRLFYGNPTPDARPVTIRWTAKGLPATVSLPPPTVGPPAPH